MIEMQEAAAFMIEAARFFHQQGWLLGTCGNLSVKLGDDPYRALVTPSGLDKSRLQPQDFLTVDREGRTLEGRGRASEEWSVHRSIYDLTPATAVCHVHSVSNNLASEIWLSEGAVVFEGIEMIKGLAGKTLHDRVELPIVPNAHAMDELAAQVAAGVRPDVPGVLVHRHGLYAWGDRPESARRHLEILEFMLDFKVRLASLR